MSIKVTKEEILRRFVQAVPEAGLPQVEYLSHSNCDAESLGRSLSNLYIFERQEVYLQHLYFHFPQEVTYV